MTVADFQEAADEHAAAIAAAAATARPAIEAMSRQVAAMESLVGRLGALFDGELPASEFSATEPPTPAITLMLEQRTVRRRTTTKPSSPPRDLSSAGRLVSYELGRASDRLAEMRTVLDHIARGLARRTSSANRQATPPMVT